MAVTQYIGPRIAPVFADPVEWSSTKQYEPLTVVTYQGNSFTSRQFVPVGINIDNADFWVETGNYNAQVEEYRRATQQVANALPIAFFEDTTVYETIQDSTRFVTPQMFGAKGDGLTDDSNAFKMALDSDKDLLIPHGTYAIKGVQPSKVDLTQNITIPSNKCIIGFGATLRVIPNNKPWSNIFTIDGSENILIQGIHFVGDRALHDYTEGSTHEWGAGIKINTASRNITIQNCVFEQFVGDAITIGRINEFTNPYPSNISIIGCNILNCRRNGISITDGNHINITNCNITNIRGTLPEEGIDLEPNSQDYRISDISIENCVIKDTGAQSIRVWLATNVTISNCETDNAISTLSPLGDSKPCTGVIVKDCYVDCSEHENLIPFSIGKDSSTYGNTFINAIIYLTNAPLNDIGYSIFKDNVVYGSLGIMATFKNETTKCNNSMIANNSFFVPANAAPHLGNTSNVQIADIVISGNNFTFTTEEQKQDAFALSGDGIQFKNNVISNCAGLVRLYTTKNIILDGNSFISFTGIYASTCVRAIAGTIIAINNVFSDCDAMSYCYQTETTAYIIERNTIIHGTSALLRALNGATVDIASQSLSMTASTNLMQAIINNTTKYSGNELTIPVETGEYLVIIIKYNQLYLMHMSKTTALYLHKPIAANLLPNNTTIDVVDEQLNIVSSDNTSVTVTIARLR